MMVVLTARDCKGAILVGILVSTALGMIFGVLDTPDDRVPVARGQRLLDDRGGAGRRATSPTR